MESKISIARKHIDDARLSLSKAGAIIQDHGGLDKTVNSMKELIGGLSISHEQLDIFEKIEGLNGGRR